MNKKYFFLLICLTTLGSLKSSEFPNDYFQNFESIKTKAIPALPQCTDPENENCQQIKKEVDEFIAAVNSRYGYIWNSNFEDVPYFQEIQKNLKKNSHIYRSFLKKTNERNFLAYLLIANNLYISYTLDNLSAEAFYTDANEVISQGLLQRYIQYLKQNPTKSIALDNFLIHELHKLCNPEVIKNRIEEVNKLAQSEDKYFINFTAKKSWENAYPKMLNKFTNEQQQKEINKLHRKFPI